MFFVSYFLYPSRMGFRFSEYVPRAPGLGAATSNSRSYCEERQQRPGVREACSEAENPCVRGIHAATTHDPAIRRTVLRYTRCTWVFGLAECVIRTPGQGIATSHSKAYGEER